MENHDTISTEKRHPIQVVANRVGLSGHLLRAWEKRYSGVIEPGRSPGGRRLYSDADIQRLRLLKEATQGGRRIGDVADVSNEKLQALVAEDRTGSAVSSLSSQDTAPVENPATEFLTASLDAATALDEQRLQNTLRAASVVLTPSQILDALVGPLMQRIGDLWVEGKIRPSQEHLATAVVRNAVASLAAQLQPSAEAHRILVVTPAGQRHEIGAVLAVAAAAVEGWRVTYLGPDLPADDIIAAAKATAADAVALSIVFPDDDPEIPGELRALRDGLGPHVDILVGGRAARAFQPVLGEIGAHELHTIPELREKLHSLNGLATLTGPA